MSIEDILRHTLALLDTCMITGSDAEKFAGAIKNIRVCVDTLEKARKEAEDDHHDEHGKDI